MQIAIHTMIQNPAFPPTPKDLPPEMTGEEFADALRSRGFSLVNFSGWSGLGYRTVKRYAAEGPAPEVARLVQLVLAAYPPNQEGVYRKRK